MSLSNRYENLLLKNTLVVEPTPGDHQINGYASLFIGLFVNSSTDSEYDQGVFVEVSDAANPDRTGAPVLSTDNLIDTHTAYSRVPLNDCNPEVTPAVEAFVAADIDARTGTQGDNTISNANPIKFATAVSDWGTITGWFITDTADLRVKGGSFGAETQPLLFGKLNTNIAVNASDRPLFAANAISIQCV